MNFMQRLLLIVLAMAAGAGAFWYLQRKGVVAGGAVVSASEKQHAVKQALRVLWSDHVIWTRQFIVSTLADLPDAKAALDRLLKNQQDLGDAIVPFYGADAGKKLAALLTDHIVIAGDVVAAAKADDKAKLKASNEKWHKNAEDIATFLSHANPENWPKNALLEMLNMHLMLTTQEAVLRLKKDWVADVKNFDKIFEQALEMADALAAGIAKQFPDKF